ncbi:MAG: hypothetical protein M0033_11335 [Nitrospiraceae bacterium]|nr:hypothetical protein [Nitrospiraceae bacterium]
MNRLLNIAVGASLIIFGIIIMIHPRFYDSAYETYFDFTGYNIPLGLFMVVLGILFIWTELRRKRKNK